MLNLLVVSAVARLELNSYSTKLAVPHPVPNLFSNSLHLKIFGYRLEA